MIEQDTIRLYRECDSGVKMGISSIGDVVDHVKSDELRTLLTDCKREQIIVICSLFFGGKDVGLHLLVDFLCGSAC